MSTPALDPLADGRAVLLRLPAARRTRSATTSDGTRHRGRAHPDRGARPRRRRRGASPTRWSRSGRPISYGRYNHPADTRDLPLDPAFTGFGRAGTDDDGAFWFETIKPGPVPFDAGQMQAPHICVAVFARGLLNHLLTRLYFADDPANAADPVLRRVPAERRGTLLAQPDAEARQSIASTSCCRARAKPCSSTCSGAAPMTEFLSLPDAIAAYVHDGSTLALEGFTHLIPFAAGHEIIRQGGATSTLIRMTPDLIYDQMIGMGCARKLVFSWGGNPGVGSLHRLRDAVEHGWPGPLEIEEHSHAAMATPMPPGRRACPARSCAATRAPTWSGINPNIRSVTCPFTGEQLAAVPALRPDLAIIHAQRADRAGQRADRRHRRRAEGGRAGGAACDRHGRGDCRRPAGASPNAVVLPALDGQRHRRGAGRRAPVLCPRLLWARQRLLHRLGHDRARPRHVPRLDGGACARVRPSRTVRPACMS